MKRSLFILLLLSSCTTVRWTQSEPDQVQASYYSLRKSVSSSIGQLLDTTVIYWYGEELAGTYETGRKENVFTHIYLVFKSNGVAYISANSSEPFNEDNIYHTGGQYCYYNVAGDELRLEIYDYHLHKFLIMQGKIYPNKVVFYRDKLRIWGGGVSKGEWIYKKSYVRYVRPLVWPQ
jgi:hypothetical protein